MNSRILVKLIPTLNKVEIGLAVALLISIYLRSQYISGSMYALTTSLVLLASFNLVGVFFPAPAEVSDIRFIILSKVIRISGMVMCIGLIFLFLKLNGFATVLMMGVFPMALGCAGVLFLGMKNFDLVRPFRYDVFRGLASILFVLTLLILKTTT